MRHQGRTRRAARCGVDSAARTRDSLRVSRPVVARGSSISAEALSTWAQAASGSARASAADAPRWILVPISGRPGRRSLDERRHPQRRGRGSAGRGEQGRVLARAAVDSSSRKSRRRLSPSTEWSLRSTGGPRPIRRERLRCCRIRRRERQALWNGGSSMATAASPGSYWSALSPRCTSGPTTARCTRRSLT